MRAALAVLVIFSVFLALPRQAGAQNPTMAVSNISWNSATFTLTCTTCPSGGWYYAKSANPSGTCSSNIPAGTYTATVTGLDTDTQYSYLAYDDSGCSNRLVQNPVTFTTPALTASSITETSATLTLKNWTRDWWYKEQDTVGCKKVSAGTSTDSLAGLQRGTTYRYYAYRSTGCSGLFIHSVRFQTTVPTGKPPKVDGFEVTTGSAFNQLNLKWTKPTNGWNITSYYVMYKRSFENIYETSYAGNEDATSHTLSGLQPDSTYNLKMYYVATPDDKKKKSFVISNHSLVLTAKTKPLPVAPPGSVTNLKVTASSPKTLTASWGAVSGAAGYNVKLSEGVYDKHAWQVSSTSYKIESTYLTVGKTYTVSVQARKTGGTTGPWSSATGVPLSAAPGQVTEVSVTPGVGELTVSWSTVSGATGYKVRWKSAGQSNWSQNTLSGGSTTTSTITGLTAGTAYTVQVIATKTNALDATPSAGKTGTPKASTPGKVGEVSVSAPSRGALNLGKLNVSWNAVTGATGYHVQWKSGNQNWDETNRQNTETGTTSAITGFVNDTTYTVRVRATKTYADNGEWSDESTGTTNAGPPGRATIASVTPGVGELSVSWGSVSDVTGYYLQWKSGNQNWDETNRQNTETGTSGTITGLTGGTTYAVRVIAYNADGKGQPSQSSTGIPKHQKPAKVGGVSAEGQVQQLRVTWSAVTNASGYEVQWKSSAQTWSSSRQNTETGTSSTITGLTGGTVYTVRVRATRTNADPGEWSDLKTGTPKRPLPDQVTGVSVTNASELSSGSWVAKLAVSWDAVTDASSYVIELKPSATTTIAVPSGTSHTISSGLTGGTEYTLRVKAKKTDADDGPWSPEAKGRPNKQPPSPATGLTLTAGIEQLGVSWTAPAAAPAPENYRVQWKSGTQEYTQDPDEKRHAVVAATETSYTILGLVGGTEHSVQVVATIQYADDSNPNQEAKETPEQAPPPPQQPGDPEPGTQPGQQGPGGSGGGPDSPGGDGVICPDYAPTETAGDVEQERDPDSLVEFVQEARVGVESILGEETEESDAIARMVGCFGVDGDWKEGSAYLFAITDERKYLLAPSGSSLAGTYLNLVDDNGCDVAAELIRAARGEALQCDDLGLLPDGDATGFVQYLWDNPADPGDDNPGYEDRGEAPGNSPKLSYVERITDEDLLPGRIIILGSGYYPNWNPPQPSPPSSGGESGGGGCAVAGAGSTLGGSVLNLLLAAGFVAAFAVSRKKFSEAKH